jgi:hypothetical protein
MAAHQMKGEPMGGHVKGALELLRNGKAKTGSNFQGDLYQAATQPGIDLEQQFDTTEPEVLQRLGFKAFRKEDFADLYMWLYPDDCKNFRQCGERIKLNMAQNPSFEPTEKMAKAINEAEVINDDDFMLTMTPVIQAVFNNPIFNSLETDESGSQKKAELRAKLEAMLMNFVKIANTKLAAQPSLDQPEPEKGGLDAVAGETFEESVKKKFKSFLLNELESQKRIGDPSYIQDIYEVAVKVSIHKTRGGDREQTFTEIRGIPGVTVVSVNPLGTSHDETLYYSTLNLKFELLARHDPLTYLKQVLFPGLRAIKGLSLRSSGQINKID